MKAWLFSWVRMLIICTVCMQLILLFVTEEEYRKYIRMFLSMLFLLILFRPLLSVGNLENELLRTMEDWAARWEYREPAVGRIYDTSGEDALVKEAVRQKLTEDITQLLAEEQMELVDLDADIRLEENDAAITKLTLTTALEKGAETSFPQAEKTVEQRLMNRYGLSAGQLQLSVRQ